MRKAHQHCDNSCVNLWLGAYMGLQIAKDTQCTEILYSLLYFILHSLYMVTCIQFVESGGF